MKAKYLKVKQYNSTYKYVILVDNIPVCITDSEHRASIILTYLEGYDVYISDGKIKKLLDKMRCTTSIGEAIKNAGFKEIDKNKYLKRGGLKMSIEHIGGPTVVTWFLPEEEPTLLDQDLLLCVSGTYGNARYEHATMAGDCYYEQGKWYWMGGVRVPDTVTVEAWAYLPVCPIYIGQNNIDKTLDKPIDRPMCQ